MSRTWLLVLFLILVSSVAFGPELDPQGLAMGPELDPIGVAVGPALDPHGIIALLA